MFLACNIVCVWYCLFQTVVSEARCKDHPNSEVSTGGDKENTLTDGPDDSNVGPDDEDEDDCGLHSQSYQSADDDTDVEPSPKRLKTGHCVLRSPPFYFNLHRHTPKGKA